MPATKTVTPTSPTSTSFTLLSRHDLRMALIVTRREVRDSFRDWRIMIPIVLLTLGFPALMNFTAGRILNFVSDFGAEVIGNQLIPFLLLVVGFFPTSFSLIIALETFVGEKERKSLEPLLATPLTNTQLYLGKMLASVIPPLSASYLGIFIYLIGLTITLDWQPTFELFVQTVLITTVQGVVMVAGAVIVSSQTTSVRASNLLASFIIVPMALLLQFEAVAMFWGNHVGLWWLIIGLAVVALVLMRMGIHLFNREELLGRDIDHIRLGWMVGVFWRRFSGRDKTYPNPLQWYRQTVAIIPQLRTPIAMTLLAFIAAICFGAAMAPRFSLADTFGEQLSGIELVANIEEYAPLLGLLPAFIILQNLRALALNSLLGVFTFGVMGLFTASIPWAFVGYLGGQLALVGENPFIFLAATILPHGLIEFPTLLLATAAALRWHTVLIAPPPGRTVSESWLEAGADYARLFIGLIIPLLIISALVETTITPQVVLRVYGG